MIEFNGKILIIGCGSVAQCSLPLLLKHIKISPKNITILDFKDNQKRIQNELNKGIRYVQERIYPKNYAQVLAAHLTAGDICLDLAWDIDSYSVIEWCHQHNVFYLNTSVEVWDSLKEHQHKSLTQLTLYARNMKLRELAQQWKGRQAPTAIVDHGANPGLVSHFTKQGLIDIANKIIENSKVKERVKLLKEALKEQDFARLAYLTGVKTIHISERDSQIHQNPKRVNEFVNTWSIVGLVEEGLAPAEIGWGTHEKHLPNEALQHTFGPKNQICLSRMGIHTWVRSWVPSGEIKGMVIRHGEAFGISDHLTLHRSDGTVIYRPTVHYAYCPCDATLNSLHELEMRRYELQPQLRILNDEIVSGVDELGCLLMGHDYQAWWIGSLLDIETARKLAPGQNATTLQVAAGVLSGIMYIIKHPYLGLCLPDDLDHKEILNIALPYLGNFVSMPVNWKPKRPSMDFLSDHYESPEDIWQFSSFLS